MTAINARAPVRRRCDTETMRTAPRLPAGRAKSMFRLGLEVFIQNKLAVVGLAVLLLAVLFCFLGPVLYPTDQVTVNLLSVNLPPGPGTRWAPTRPGTTSWPAHGRRARCRWSIGFAAALHRHDRRHPVGRGGRVLRRLDRCGHDARSSMRCCPSPSCSCCSSWSRSSRPSIPVMIFVLGADGVAGAGPPGARGGADAAGARVRAGRARDGRVHRAHSVLRHILPNVIGTVIVNATFQVADAILLVAYLGYLGLGISPPATDWGGMLSDGTAYVFTNFWWLIYPPGIAIIIVVVAVQPGGRRAAGLRRGQAATALSARDSNQRITATQDWGAGHAATWRFATSARTSG